MRVRVLAATVSVVWKARSHSAWRSVALHTHTFEKEQGTAVEM